MPIVDYKDTVTGEVFEEFIRGKVIPSEMVSPAGNRAERIFTTGSFGFEFKGPGFYETDYKRKSGPADAGVQG
jgi:predicted nucleic acid-binding Zn ribbon protein